MGQVINLPTHNMEEDWSSSCSKIGAGVTDTASKVSNGTPELSTCSEELSEPWNESDEPSEGSDGASVMDELMNNITSPPEAIQQPEVIEMACIREYYHYAIE